jgi:phosphate transport system permease protein
MQTSWLLFALLLLAIAGFVVGRSRAMQSAGGDMRVLHSLPNFYGWNVALLSIVPALVVFGLWQAVQPNLINRSVVPMVTTETISGGAVSLAMSDVRRVARGLDIAVSGGLLTSEEARNLADGDTTIRQQLAAVGTVVGSEIRPEVLAAAQRYRVMTSTGTTLQWVVVLLVAVGGAFVGVRQTSTEFRARNAVERVVRAVLVFAATIAILTTVGIGFSLIFNTIKFFGLHPASDFLFGTTWNPLFRGGSSLGILPLLWGTLYISIIALLVAVPIGLFSAIYLAEYASPAARSFIKPALEVLAGIPTIVYGLFALLTVGPLLVSAFGPNGFLGLGWMRGGSAVMTAGLVMGIMLIPFVSSLSDDIINAVPQAMRDGSYGLGATKSETVRMVVLPAALPGIAGAVLLAASRAIGETMIVVLGAGAAARLSLNPFEAMTTVTAKIVAQLTGDNDFNSPEALVAFALGMTLFVVTLILNIAALYIVRKYREQYE